jgi:acetylornithine deacetylase/succinyl-diaminopimelate desuccinylase-like protein
MYGHVDVVTTANQVWAHPPFGGDIVDGLVWGRGALDMKGGMAMMVSAFLRAKEEGLELPGDVILAVLSDEEVDGEYGAKYLVENHPEHFADIRYAIGEGGGVSVRVDGRKFYPIMVNEKQVCSLRAVVRGPGGHGSIPKRGGAMAKLSHLLRVLDRRRLPVHIVPVVGDMIKMMSQVLPFPRSLVLRQLLNPIMTDVVIGHLGEKDRRLSALVRNTVSPTMVQGGHKINVIPSQITLDLDARLLPGFKPDDVMRELNQLWGDGIPLEVMRYDPGPGDPDMSLFDTLAGVLREVDPQGTPIPSLLSGATDGRYFSRLGIQTYGFLPMDLPEELITTVHAADERVPAEAITFGSQVIYSLLQRLDG